MTDELKKALENAKTEKEKQEVKEVAEELIPAARSLSDEELGGVTGGASMPALHQYA